MKFETRIAKQLITHTKAEQINLLEQLLYDFKESKNIIYIDKVWPSKKESGYGDFAKYTMIQERYVKNYTIESQLDSELAMFMMLCLHPNEDESDKALSQEIVSNLNMESIFDRSASSFYHSAQEQIRLRLARLIGRESALKWVLDPYDRVREKMIIEQMKLSSDYAGSDQRPWQEQVKYYRQLDEMQIKYGDNELPGAEKSTKIVNAPPLQWKGQINHILELFVELHRKGFIDLENSNYANVSKAICQLFNTSEGSYGGSWQTMKAYLSTNVDKEEIPRKAGRENDFANLQKLPTLRNRKFAGIKSIRPEE